jgi:hypothetical protein
MRMTGLNPPETHLRYETPAESEILRARDITWSYLEAIVKGRPFFTPTTPYDLFERILVHRKMLPDIIRAAMREELDGSFANLSEAMLAAFAGQEARIREQMKRHEAHIDQKMEEQRRLLDQLKETIQPALKVAAPLAA